MYRGICTYSKGIFKTSSILHTVLCADSILARQHLHKSMSLVLVDNASLDSAVAAENAAQFGFGTSDA
jgi:hypothetical protein